jgi:hypothetical protein
MTYSTCRKTVGQWFDHSLHLFRVNRWTMTHSSVPTLSKQRQFSWQEWPKLWQIIAVKTCLHLSNDGYSKYHNYNPSRHLAPSTYYLLIGNHTSYLGSPRFKTRRQEQVTWLWSPVAFLTDYRLITEHCPQQYFFCCVQSHCHRMCFKKLLCGNGHHSNSLTPEFWFLDVTSHCITISR